MFVLLNVFSPDTDEPVRVCGVFETLEGALEDVAEREDLEDGVGDETGWYVEDEFEEWSLSFDHMPLKLKCGEVEAWGWYEVYGV